MIAAVINAILILLGSFAGIIFSKKINEKASKYIMYGLAMCVMLIGMSSALKDQDTLCVIISMAVGIVLGELLRIEDRVDALGEKLKMLFSSGKTDTSRFTEGFMTATLLFCVGSMAVVGSFEAGINHDYSIIISKSVIDCISAVTFAAAMGIGVAFSALSVFVYQAAITLIAIISGPFLSDIVINQMSAVGGLLIMALSFNMLEIKKERLRVGNMLPAIFIPIIYMPVSQWISGVFA